MTVINTKVTVYDDPLESLSVPPMSAQADTGFSQGICYASRFGAAGYIKIMQTHT